jgi:hypothetical protein
MKTVIFQLKVKHSSVRRFKKELSTICLKYDIPQSQYQIASKTRWFGIIDDVVTIVMSADERQIKLVEMVLTGTVDEPILNYI